MIVESFDADATARSADALAAILKDAVNGGASVGFLPPLGDAEATAYWREVADAVRAGTRVLLVAREPDGGLVGTAQLDLSEKPNARHRAEAMKVMVLGRARRRGAGRALMLALEAHARRLGRTTLVLDTRQGDPSEKLYVSVGWRPAGVIPRYAESAGGTLDGSAFYYRLLH